MRILLKAQSLLLPLSLGAWGCILLRLHLSGQLSQIQNPAYHDITLSFGILLMLICVSYPFFFDLFSENGSHLTAQAAGRAALLALPLAAYLLLPEDLQSAQFLRQRASYNLLSPAALQRFLPGKPGELHRLLLEQVDEVSKDEVVLLDLLELIYLSQDRVLRERYNGQRVVISGQWLSEDETHFKIARLLIFCCAADGRTVALRVNGRTDLKSDGVFIEVTGTLGFKTDTPVPELELIDYIQNNDTPDSGM